MSARIWIRPKQIVTWTNSGQKLTYKLCIWIERKYQTKWYKMTESNLLLCKHKTICSKQTNKIVSLWKVNVLHYLKTNFLLFGRYIVFIDDEERKAYTTYLTNVARKHTHTHRRGDAAERISKNILRAMTTNMSYM